MNYAFSYSSNSLISVEVLDIRHLVPKHYVSTLYQFSLHKSFTFGIPQGWHLAPGSSSSASWHSLWSMTPRALPVHPCFWQTVKPLQLSDTSVWSAERGQTWLFTLLIWLLEMSVVQSYSDCTECTQKAWGSLVSIEVVSKCLDQKEEII